MKVNHTANTMGLLFLLISSASGLQVHNKGEELTARLFDAVRHGSVAETVMLLDEGADVNVRDRFGRSSLILASTQSLPLVRALVTRGAEVDWRDAKGETALMKAVQFRRSEIVDFLLSQGADVKKLSKQQDTVLSLAVDDTDLGEGRKLAPNAAIVHSLISNGADPDTRARRRSAYCMALEDAKWDLASDMSRVAKVTDDSRICSLVGWTRCGDASQVRSLLNQGLSANARDRAGEALLVIASKGGHIPVVTMLLDAKARINEGDKEGMTALMWAAAKGQSEVVEILLRRGAGAQVRDRDGRTPLMLASTQDNSRIVSSLLDHGATPNARDHIGRTALHYACLGYAPAHLMRIELPETVELLLCHGAGPLIKDRRGDTPQDYANRNGFSKTYELISNARRQIRVPGK